MKLLRKAILPLILAICFGYYFFSIPKNPVISFIPVAVDQTLQLDLDGERIEVRRQYSKRPGQYTITVSSEFLDPMKQSATLQLSGNTVQQIQLSEHFDFLGKVNIHEKLTLQSSTQETSRVATEAKDEAHLVPPGAYLVLMDTQRLGEIQVNPAQIVSTGIPVELFMELGRQEDELAKSQMELGAALKKANNEVARLKESNSTKTTTLGEKKKQLNGIVSNIRAEQSKANKNNSETAKLNRASKTYSDVFVRFKTYWSKPRFTYNLNPVPENVK